MDWIFGMGIQPRGSLRTRDRKCISAKKKKWCVIIKLKSSDQEFWSEKTVDSQSKIFWRKLIASKDKIVKFKGFFIYFFEWSCPAEWRKKSPQKVDFSLWGNRTTTCRSSPQIHIELLFFSFQASTHSACLDVCFDKINYIIRFN